MSELLDNTPEESAKHLTLGQYEALCRQEPKFAMSNVLHQYLSCIGGQAEEF